MDAKSALKTKLTERHVFASCVQAQTQSATGLGVNQ